MTLFGYAGEILLYDLSTQIATRLPTADYVERFIGGRGLAAKLYWDYVPPEAKAFDPTNALICATGPAAGFPGFAGSRWQICGKAVHGQSETFSYGNLGGKWGVALKYAGYDALLVRGKAQAPVYLYIADGRVEVHDAAHLWGKTTFDTSDILKAAHGEGVSILTIGPAAENRLPFATVLAEEGASGSGGMGAIMGSKRLKAVVVAGDRKPRAAHPEQVRQLASQIRKIVKLAPYHKEMWAIPGQSRLTICYGCGLGCGRHIYTAEKGRTFKSFCQATEVYIGEHLAAGDAKFEAKLLGIRLSDAYGMDTAVLAGMIQFLNACYRDGLLTEKETGLAFSKYGSPEFIQDLTHKIARREGFGAILAEGTIEAARRIGKKAQEHIGYYVATGNGETKDYDPRLMPMTALLYATEPRRPIQQLHEPVSYLFRWLDHARGEGEPDFSGRYFQTVARRLWGSAEAADFTTIKGKAQAAINIQQRAYVKESLILCDLSWMGVWSKYLADHPEHPVLENQVYTAITGNEIDEAGLGRIGSRLYNMQRAVLLRQGWRGREDDVLLDYYHHQPLAHGEIFYNPECIVPGKDGERVDVTGRVLPREDFETMKSEFYRLRGWDVASGLPTRAQLERLDLKEVADDLAGRGLLKPP